MKQKLLTKLLTLVLLTLGGVINPAWAADESITFSDLSLTNSKQYSSFAGSSYSLNFDLAFGDGANDGKYYTTGSAIRVYGGGHMIVSSSKMIEKIELTFGSGEGSNSITTNVGTYSDGTWTGSANSVTFNVGGSSGHRRIATVAVTYASASKVLKPIFSHDSGALASGTNVTISCDTDETTIYYTMTTDGSTPDDPTTSSSKYTGPINITVATKIKAIAIDDNGILTNSDIESVSYTIAEPCATPTFSVAAGEVVKGTTVTITCATAGATIYYTTNGDKPTTSSSRYSSALTINTNQTIKAIAAKEGNANSAVASVSYTVQDYTSLPFEWAGGIKSNLAAVTGVTTSGLGSDYASTNAPYYVKMDGEGDFIQVKTNAQPGKVYVGVKMIGGNTTSKIKVQESADGTSFIDVEEFTVSGKQNDVLNFETSNSFAATTRYVKIIKSVHGSNVGVGPITITGCEAVTVTSAGYATYASTSPLDFTGKDIKAYIAEQNGTTGVTFTQVNKVPANTGVLLYKDGGATEVIPVFDGAADDVTGNVFVKGEGAAVTSEDGNYRNYILNKPSEKPIGFYKAAGQTVAKNRAYIHIDASAAIKEFIALPDFEDDATSIEETLSNSPLKGENIYNLAGQRLNKMQKGINIVNGKKIMVK